MDVSVRVTTKGTAKYDKPCELQNSVKQQNFECILCFWLPLRAALIQCVLLPPPRNDMVRDCYLPELVCQRMLRADVLNACATCVLSRCHKCMLAHAYGYGAAYCARTHTLCIALELCLLWCPLHMKLSQQAC